MEEENTLQVFVMIFWLLLFLICPPLSLTASDLVWALMVLFLLFTTFIVQFMCG